jgi:anaerobic ribonucleoside-triphosphate reductase
MSIAEQQIDIQDGDKIVGKGVRFERIRRITGYLVGTMNRWNNAKRAEERDRVKHVSVRQV